MIAFGSGMSAALTAQAAAHEAATVALLALEGQTPRLAIVFASVSYPDVDSAARAVRSVIGDAQIVGGTSGVCVFGDDRIAARGVSVVLLGGDGLEVESRIAKLGSPTFMETVPIAERVAQAAQRSAGRGFGQFACLVFAPGLEVDGEALVAAVRKGAGAHAQLAGGLTDVDFAMDRPKVFFGDELRDDCIVITGLFTKTPVGIAARHGWGAVGPVRRVTRAEGIHLVELDGRPALDVWLEDARSAGGRPPTDRGQITAYLAKHYDIGITGASSSRIAIVGDPRELVARAPFGIRADGAMQMSATIAEGSHVRVIHATRSDLLKASSEAAADAVLRAGSRVAGALVLECSSRFSALGDLFPQEPAEIRRQLGAPIAGACVCGEIARNIRDVDAFFNTTTVIVAFAA